jgi:hypothetical protein
MELVGALAAHPTARPPPAEPQPGCARTTAAPSPPLVIFLALGTRGDVQPLALLAWWLAHAPARVPGAPSVGARGPPTVTFITHLAHATWLRALLPGLHLGAGLPHAPGAAAGSAGVDAPAARAALVTAVCSALQLALPSQQGSGGGGGGGIEGREATGSAARPRQPHDQPHLQRHPGVRARLLVFNLFALEGAHLAEALGVPCAAAHPYPIPYACPAAFERRLATAHPRLHAALRDPAPGAVGWGEVSRGASGDCPPAVMRRGVSPVLTGAKTQGRSWSPCSCCDTMLLP